MLKVTKKKSGSPSLTRKDEAYLFFWSRGKIKKFSNFYGVEIQVVWPLMSDDDIPDFLRGLTRTYPSSEHAYQALKCGDLGSADEFTTRGLFGNFDVYSVWPKGGQKFTPERMRGTWGECIGIVAKMVSKLEPKVIKRTWGVTFQQRRLSEQVWGAILRAKYGRGSVLGKALLATGEKILVEYDRSSRLSFWGAKLDAKGGLVGANAFGELLMAHRRALQA